MVPLWQRMMLAGQWTAQPQLAAGGAVILRQITAGQMADTARQSHHLSQMTAMAVVSAKADAARSDPATIGDYSALRGPSSRTAGTVSPAAVINIELRSLSSCRLLMGEWRELQSRCLEANAFAAPEIMLAAAQHLPAAQPPMALVFRNSQRLLGIIPLESARLPVLPGALHSYVTPYHPVGVPLIDRRHGEAVINRALQWCADQAEPLSSISGDTLGLAGIVWRKLPLDGPFASLLRQIASQSGRELQMLDVYERPVLRVRQPARGTHQEPATEQSRNLRRLIKRINQTGPLRFVEAVTSPAINQALENLMVLEAAGWKGERGTAMVQDARISCFIRSTVRQMATRGQASIITMMCGEAPVAAALMLEAQGVHFCFKIAYDPAFAKYSPGLILADEIGVRLRARPGFRFADSCVDQAESFMSRVWPETARFGDIMIALAGHATPAASAMRLREQLRRRLRSDAKRLYHRMYRRLHG